MGSWYASVHLRSPDRESLLPVLESAATDRALQLLCGPVIGGWVGVYPSKDAGDLAAALASRWPGDIFYLGLHDDAVMQYVFFNAGRTRDSYWSTPGYFDERTRWADEAQFGDPETYAHLIGGDVARAASILERGDPSSREFQSELGRLLEFVDLLGISNVEASYEYLKNGERHGIRDWKQFVHLPERATADQRRTSAAAKSARKTEHKRLIAEGLLLAVAETGDWRQPVTLTVRQRPVEVAFDFQTRQSGIACPDNSCVVRISTGRRAGDSIEIVPNGDAPARKLPAGAEAAQPGGEPLAAMPSKPALELLELTSTLVDMPPAQALASMLAVVPPDRRAIVEQHMRRVLPVPPWTVEQAQHLALMAVYSTNRMDRVHDLCFSADGHWLACGTSHGVRVAAWSDVMAASDGSPAPWRYSFDVPPFVLDAASGHGHVYSIVYDTASDCFVFGGNDGRVRTMSLADGRVEELLELYQRATVMRMKWLDRDTLAIYAQPELAKTGRRPPPKALVYVWSYPALRERGGPVDPPLAPHARVAIPGEALEARPSPVERALSTLRSEHARKPEQIRLELLGSGDWPDDDTRERFVDPLLKAGFRSTDPFVVPALDNLLVQLFSHPERCLIATLLKTREHGTILNLVSDQSDGTSFSCTNRSPTGLKEPSNWTVLHAQGADAKGLLYLMSRHRPPGAWIAIPVDELPGRFEAGYAKGRAWREKRGFSEAEAVRVARISEHDSAPQNRR